MTFVLAVAGGHQSSTAAVLSESGFLTSVSGEAVSVHTLHPDKLGTRIDRMLSDLAIKLKIADEDLRAQCSRLVLGLPGIATDYDQQYALLGMRSVGWTNVQNTLVVDDTLCGLFAGLRAEEGICAIANSGASVLAIGPNGHRWKYDGWGSVIGDFGGGFDVAQHLFHFLNRQRDGRKEHFLFIQLKEWLSAQRYPDLRITQELQLWFDNICREYPFEWRYRFAQTAAVVTKAATLGDPDAMRILDLASARMVETISLPLLDYPNLQSTVICAQGGMFEHSPRYLRGVSQQLADRYSVHLELSQYRPIVGALLIGMSGRDHLPCQEKIDELLGAIDRNLPNKSHFLTALEGDACPPTTVLLP